MVDFRHQQISILATMGMRWCLDSNHTISVLPTMCNSDIYQAGTIQAVGVQGVPDQPNSLCLYKDEKWQVIPAHCSFSTRKNTNVCWFWDQMVIMDDSDDAGGQMRRGRTTTAPFGTHRQLTTWMCLYPNRRAHTPLPNLSVHSCLHFHLCLWTLSSCTPSHTMIQEQRHTA